MQRKETYDLPPPALSGSGSKGTSQLFSAPGALMLFVFENIVKQNDVLGQ